jgi:hypothetical protein
MSAFVGGTAILALLLFQCVVDQNITNGTPVAGDVNWDQMSQIALTSNATAEMLQNSLMVTIGVLAVLAIAALGCRYGRIHTRWLCIRQPVTEKKKRNRSD